MLNHVYNLSRPGYVPIILRVTVTNVNMSLIVYVRLNAAPTPLTYNWLITKDKVTSQFQLYLNPIDTFNASQIYVGVQSASYGLSNKISDIAHSLFVYVFCTFWFI